MEQCVYKTVQKWTFSVLELDNDYPQFFLCVFRLVTSIIFLVICSLVHYGLRTIPERYRFKADMLVFIIEGTGKIMGNHKSVIFKESVFSGSEMSIKITPTQCYLHNSITCPGSYLFQKELISKSWRHCWLSILD